MKPDFRAEPELMDLMKVEVMPCFAIYSAANAVTRFYRRTLARLGLTYPQYLVMMVMWETKGATMKELGEKLLLDSSTLTPLVKKLEADGLVTRARNRDDERLLDISPTPKGMALRADGCDAAMAMIEGSGETLDGMRELAVRLGRIRDSLAAAADGHAPG